MSELLQRAVRTVAASRYGTEINAFFQNPEVQKKLVDAARTGRPPVAAVSRELLAAVPRVGEDPTAKRRIGLLIGALLDAEGFEPDRPGVRITDPLFNSGSTYRLKPEGHGSGRSRDSSASDADEFIRRICRTMTNHQAGVAIETLRTSFPDVFVRAAMATRAAEGDPGDAE
jgi:hypothetical protein